MVFEAKPSHSPSEQAAFGVLNAKVPSIPMANLSAARNHNTLNSIMFASLDTCLVELKLKRFKASWRLFACID